MALTAANCQIFLRDIITNPTSILTYWNSIADNNISGVAEFIDGNSFFSGNIFGTLAGNHANGSLCSTCIGSTDTMPTANHTYAPGDTTFSNTWFLAHTLNAQSDAVYSNTACTTTSDISNWGSSFHTQLTAQITATATDAGISFETVCSQLDAAFRQSGDATAGYCMALIRQNDNGDGTFSCGSPGSHLIAPFTTARVYLSALIDPPTGTFSGSPTTINNGDAVVLTWTSSGATSASIDNGVGSVSPISGGNVTVHPTSTTTYTLTLSNAGGTTTKTSTITVNHPSPTGTFTASPNPITVGDSTTLTWTSDNATSASIDHGVGTVTPTAGGTHSVSPTVTTTYTLTLTNADGTTLKTVTVTVYPVATGTFAATPSHIFQGQVAPLTWTTSGAASVSIDNSIGSVSPVAGGTVDAHPSVSTTYTLTMTNPAGHVSPTLSTTVTVDVPPAFRIFFADIDQTLLKDWVRGTTDLSGTIFPSFLEVNQTLPDINTKTNVPYLYTFLLNGDAPTDQSAFVRIAWDWTPMDSLVKVTPEEQVYNHFSDNYLLSVKKTRIRGKGRFIRVRYDGELDKNFNLRGWVIFYDANAQQ